MPESTYVWKLYYDDDPETPYCASLQPGSGKLLGEPVDCVRDACIISEDVQGIIQAFIDPRGVVQDFQGEPGTIDVVVRSEDEDKFSEGDLSILKSECLSVTLRVIEDEFRRRCNVQLESLKEPYEVYFRTRQRYFSD